MTAPADRLRRLAVAQTKDHLVEALWDLRDSAYDRPQDWNALTAEVVWQGLATRLEQAPTAADGQVSTSLVLRARPRRWTLLGSECQPICCTGGRRVWQAVA